MMNFFPLTHDPKLLVKRCGEFSHAAIHLQGKGIAGHASVVALIFVVHRADVQGVCREQIFATISTSIFISQNGTRVFRKGKLAYGKEGKKSNCGCTV
jgi:hypothetical protein